MWINRVFRKIFPKVERSSSYPISQWIKHISKYGLGGSMRQVQGQTQASEGVPNDFDTYAQRLYKGNGVFFGVCRVRRSVFSQIDFKWRLKDSDAPEHTLDDTPDLDILDNPGPGVSTAAFLARAIQDVDIAGNAYWAKERIRGTDKMRLRRLRPDWVDIVLSAPPEEAVESDVIGYAYYPGGAGHGTPIVYTVEEVAHWDGNSPDPEAQYRGMSWMTPVLRDWVVEHQANEHRINFFKNGARANLVVAMNEYHDDEAMDAIEARFRATHAGPDNAFNTVFVSAGADLIPLTMDLSSLDMANVSGRAETHIAMAAGVHPTVAGMMEGMQGASLNSGNYKVAERGFINITMHPLWASLCSALETVVPPPKPTRRKPDKKKLWYSTAGVSILNDDRLERAQIRNQEMETVDKAVREGWTPESAIEFVVTGDPRKLVHSGYKSVQLYKPIDGDPADAGSNLAPTNLDPSLKNPEPKEKPAQPNLDPKSGQNKAPSPPVKEN